MEDKELIKLIDGLTWFNEVKKLQEILSRMANNIKNQSVSTEEDFVAEAGQTIFELSNTPNNVSVVVSRVPQIQGILFDYTLEGNKVVFNKGLRENDIVVIRKY